MHGDPPSTGSGYAMVTHTQTKYMYVVRESRPWLIWSVILSMELPDTGEHVIQTGPPRHPHPPKQAKASLLSARKADRGVVRDMVLRLSQSAM